MTPRGPASPLGRAPQAVRARKDEIKWTGLNFAPPSTFKQTGSDEWRGPCVYHPGSRNTFTANPAAEKFRCYKCGDKLAGEVLETHARTLGIWTEPVNGEAKPGPLDVWTWKTADGRERKQFRWPDGKKWQKTDPPNTPPPAELLYFPPGAPPRTIPSTGVIFACEGASDADAIRARGLRAFAYFNVHATDDSVGRLPKDERIVVFGDFDEDGAGYKQANRLRDHLVGLGYTAHVVDMAKLHPEGKPPAGFDARDWTATLPAGTTSVQAQEVILEAVVDRHADFEPEQRPDPVDAAVEALTGGGRRGVPERLDELVVAVTAAELTGTRLTAVRSAALAKLTEQRFMLAPEARQMLDEAFKSDADDQMQGTAIEWDEVEPAGVPVPLARILDRLVEQLRRFMYLPDGAAEVVACVDRVDMGRAPLADPAGAGDRVAYTAMRQDDPDEPDRPVPGAAEAILFHHGGRAVSVHREAPAHDAARPGPGLDEGPRRRRRRPPGCAGRWP